MPVSTFLTLLSVATLHGFWEVLKKFGPTCAMLAVSLTWVASGETFAAPGELVNWLTFLGLATMLQGTAQLLSSHARDPMSYLNETMRTTPRRFRSTFLVLLCMYLPATSLAGVTAILMASPFVICLAIVVAIFATLDMTDCIMSTMPPSTY